MCRAVDSRHDGRVTQTSPLPAADPRLTGRAGWAAAGAVVAFVVIGLAVRLARGGTPVPAVAAAAAVSLLAVALLTRGRAVLPLALAAAAGIVVLCTGEAANVGWFGVCLLAGWCSLVAPRPQALVFWVAALLVFGAEQLWAESDAGWASWSIGTTLMTFAVLVLRRQRRLVAELRAAQAGLADRARAEERTRIARELHDVIAHSLTVTLLHIAGARMAIRFDAADADRALAEAERLGRASLDEVRATVGLLAAGDADGTAAPLPGLAAVPDLVEGFRAAGATVGLAVEGEPAGVPATTGLAVYRIVQEALTNAAKHAPGAPVDVLVTCGPSVEVVEVVVDSAGRPGTGHGLGLDGMRERATSLGGTLTAGPGGPGWRVRAELPLPAARERSTR
jgi:signal transduction histidine kinase